MEWGENKFNLYFRAGEEKLMCFKGKPQKSPIFDGTENFIFWKSKMSEFRVKDKKIEKS